MIGNVLVQIKWSWSFRVIFLIVRKCEVLTVCDKWAANRLLSVLLPNNADFWLIPLHFQLFSSVTFSSISFYFIILFVCVRVWCVCVCVCARVHVYVYMYICFFFHAYITFVYVHLNSCTWVVYTYVYIL